MKNLICVILISFSFMNCNGQEKIKTISTIELKALLAKESIQLLDVRSPEEIAAGVIKTSIFANYFERDFTEKALKQLDNTKPVYLVCRSGNRSGKSAIILKEKGFDVYNVVGGYLQWVKEN